MTKLAHQNSPPPSGPEDGAQQGAVADLVGLEPFVINMADRLTHNSNTDLIGGAISFNPLDYVRPGLDRDIVFRAMVAMGDVTPLGQIVLRNITSATDIATLNIGGVVTSKYESISLTLPDADNVYEVIMHLTNPSTGPTDTIELYSAELRVLFSVPGD